MLAAPAVLRRRALPATTLTLGHGAAPGNPRTLAAEVFAKLVSEKSEGRVTVNIAGSEQLGNDVAVTSLRTGALDITANSQGAASGLVPELATLGLPFLFQDSTAAFKVLDGPIGTELAEKFALSVYAVIEPQPGATNPTTRPVPAQHCCARAFQLKGKGINPHKLAMSRSQAFEESENVSRNASANPTMGDIIATRYNRRELMKNSLAVAAMAATVSPLALAAGRQRKGGVARGRVRGSPRSRPAWTKPTTWPPAMAPTC